MDFDWDAGNVDHIIEEHDVWPEEVVQVLYNRPVLVSQGVQEGEFRYRVVGRTDEDRILTVIYTHRGERIRVVTAFESGPAEIRKYRGGRGKRG